ncbi:ParB/RepB/Spo0J family partition protein [Paracoccus sp. R12_1]|uniref:ParB/RepB/Spo0J family partition protein n=1 Tax=unclassified Paracoccus (in: a-proteobacteria) TaxID=2688777 RepID=UPI001ADAFD2D|nr:MULTISPECIES: ParB/RepB/Spo0J family partition protein [unclassified Paracoccus (in: a-proteobacteria)]MBO9455366.1 ParB/RepB/Spo0J family partition protein [Paracoccus sp. R12_2]MBO9485846.1 ParB/RepB/Spo0J family partition protein [Paracoccus sp. R12_1]
MTKQQKITLSASRDIPFNKLMLSQSNVRHVKAGVSIEELAEDIARRTLLSSITVRPVLDDSGTETGMYTIPAGGRRFRALELLVKQKRMNKTALVPCIVRTDGLAEEDSLAENVQRAPLHPLDQFRAFQAMREKGRTEEEIAAAFFVSASVVKQRLKLAAVAPSLLDAYAEEEMTLDQLMAFTVNPDQARQEQVWEALQRHYSRQPYEIRRMLTEGAVRASDKRAQFVGLDDYVEAGGEILRDLFQQDDGGWLQDAALLDVMVREKLAEEAETVRAEGWKWVEVDTEFPYGHTFRMRRVHGEAVPMSDEEAASYQALKAEYDALEAEHAEADELPDEVDTRLGKIEEAMEAFEARPIRFEADDLALAGAFVSIDSSGRLRVERGDVRPEDEPVEEVEDIADGTSEEPTIEDADDPISPALDDEEEEDDGLKPLSDRLVMELTAHRTLALRNALAQDPQVAFLAALHAVVLRLFYRYAVDSCVEIEPRNAGFGSQVPGLGDTAYAQAIDQRHETWARNLPKASEDLWKTLTEFDSCGREALFAHCVAMSVNAVHDPYQRRLRAIAHADVLAGTVGLDMAKAGWTATGDSYLGRVTKARILEAVREAKGEAAADRIAGLKKAEMVTAAEDLLVGTSWLPDPLRTPPLPGEDAPEIELIDTADGGPSGDETDTGEAQSAEDDGEPAIGDSEHLGEDDPVAGDAFARTAAE